jgi:hypothetical protein
MVELVEFHRSNDIRVAGRDPLRLVAGIPRA